MNWKEQFNELNKYIVELRELGFNKRQILTILNIIEVKNFNYEYGYISFELSDEMTIKEIKKVINQVEQILTNVDVSVYTNVSLTQLVFDIEC